MSTPGRLCGACVELLDVDGAGIALISRGELRGLVCASDATTGVLERLQFDLGDGPCGSAFSAATPVLVSNLDDGRGRWPVFTAEALAMGVHAVFSFPLGPGLAGIGVLTLYRNEARDLTEEQLADCLVLADLLTEVIVTIELRGPIDELPEKLRGAADDRAEIHQATGMVSAQLDIPPGDALSRLRARAWAEHRSLAELASDVVARRYRFPAETDPRGGPIAW